jgi:cation transport ATPase
MREKAIDILEDYLEQRKNHHIIPEIKLQQRFRRIGIPEEEMHEVLVELNHEWSKEQTNQINYKKAKTQIIFGLLISLLAMVLSILSALGLVFGSQLFIFTYGGIATGLIAAIAGYSTIRGARSKKKRRELKWSMWDKKTTTF